MANQKEFINVLLKNVKITTKDYKDGENQDDQQARKVKRKTVSIYGIDVDKHEELSIIEVDDRKKVAFPKRVERTIYTRKDTDENYIYIPYSGKVKLLNENDMTRQVGLVMDEKLPNVEISDADINISISYNDEAKGYIGRVNTVRIKKGATVTEIITGFTFEDEDEFTTVTEDEFTTVTEDGEIIGSLDTSAAKMIEG